MPNIAVIGATGKLGSHLLTKANTVSLPWRFEDSQQELNDWFTKNPTIDTVWHVARTCRNIQPRRDHLTFMSEYDGMNKLMSSKASECRFIYASSKIVYGLAGTDGYQQLPLEDIAEQFNDDKIGIFNCPDYMKYNEIKLTDLANDTNTYALTKLASEYLIQKHCKNHKILRIWDL